MLNKAALEAHINDIALILQGYSNFKIEVLRKNRSTYNSTTRSFDKLPDLWCEVGTTSDPSKGQFEIDWELGDYRLTAEVMGTKPGQPAVMGTWTLYQLQHCCAICVSCQATVAKDVQRKGLGRILNRVRQTIARELGYSLLMCTDITTNAAQRAVLKVNGWTDVYQVLNRRTNNTVIISVINL